MNNFDQIKKVYFLGIGGIGVSAIARMFLHEEKQVFGSDTSGSEITEELSKEGADIFIGQDIKHIPYDTDLVIYTIAIEKFAGEFLDAVKQKVGDGKVISYPESLSVISKDKYTIAICGTHGKTTTIAMIAKIMMDAGLDPTVIVGSIMADGKSNFIAGKSKLARMPNGEAGGYLVVEACEYCRSFLNINPTIVGITTIDNDHMDYYKDEGDILEAFKEFAQKIPDQGVLIGDLSNQKICEVSKAISSKLQVISSLNFYNQNLKLRIPGEHNRRNASVALAIAEFLSIDKNSAIASLEAFSGTWRRFEYKGKMQNGVIVYDDYAHHPSEIEATLQGARELYPDKKITIVFQPHLYSRTKFLFDDFVNALAKADSVILTPIYAAREEKDESIGSEMLAEKIKEKNLNVLYFHTQDEIAEEIKKSASGGDLILIMGAGSISNLASALV